MKWSLNRWRADFEFDQGGHIPHWKNLKSRLATPFMTLVFDTTDEAAKVHSTSDRTYPSLTTTEGREAQRAKFWQYVTTIKLLWLNSENYSITAAEYLNPERRQMTLLESIFLIGPYSRYFQLFSRDVQQFFREAVKAMRITKDTESRPKLSSTDSWLTIPSAWVWGRCWCITCLSFTLPWYAHPNFKQTNKIWPE